MRRISNRACLRASRWSANTRAQSASTQRRALIHSGAMIHHHDQVMTPVSLSRVHGWRGVAYLAREPRGAWNHRWVDRTSFEEIGGYLRDLLIRLDDRIPARDFVVITGVVPA